MTKKEKILILREKGNTYRKIGELCDCSEQYAWQVCNPKGIKKKTIAENECCYPALRKWLNDCGFSVGDVSVVLYGRRDGNYPSQVRKVLSGRGTLYKDLIDRILDYTGLTYEEAFADG